MSQIASVNSSLFPPVSTTSSRPQEATANATSADVNKLVAAKFSDIYKGVIANAVDTDHDMKISMDEYQAQITHSGGSATSAAAKFKAIDTDQDGSLSIDEFSKSIKSPDNSDQDALYAKLIDQIRVGMGASQPQGTVLDAQGQVANPDAALQYVAQKFSGNLYDV